MMSPCLQLLLFMTVLTGNVHGWLFSKISGDTIARTADNYIDSTKWSYASSHGPGEKTNKCNIFVADVLKEAGVKVPQRYWWWSPIGAGEWGNPQSTYLAGNSCWSRVYTAKRGDVIAGGGHVGIVTGTRLTTSANDKEVVKNDWGFRSSNPNIVLWRYQC